METLRDRAYRHIHAKLLRGELGPGDRLSNRKLASEIGISLIPVREAIGQLVSAGLVEHRPGIGSFVAAFTREDICELYDLREALECHAAGVAAGRVDCGELEDMRRANAVLCGVVDILEGGTDEVLSPELRDRWQIADARLHLSIFRAAGNRRALRTLRQLRMITRIFGWRSPHRPIGRLRRTCREHAAIIDALEAGDSDVCRELMARHIRQGCEGALEAYEDRRLAEASTPPIGLREVLERMASPDEKES